MTNIMKMLQQAQAMQSKMAAMQTQLDEVEVGGQSAGGMVRVTMTAKGKMRSIKIDPKLADPNEIEMLEDSILAACNDAKTKADTHVAGETEKMMGDIKLPPGVKLPF